MIATSVFFLFFLCATLRAQVYTKNWYKGTQCAGNPIQEYYLFPLPVGCETTNNGGLETSYLASCNSTEIQYTNCSDTSCSSSCITTLTPPGTCTANSDGLTSIKHGCVDANPFAQPHHGIVQLTYFSDPLCSQQENGITFIPVEVCAIEGNGSGYYQCNDSYNVYHTQCLDRECKQGCTTTKRANYCDNSMYHLCFPKNTSAIVTSAASTTNSSPALLPLLFFYLFVIAICMRQAI